MTTSYGIPSQVCRRAVTGGGPDGCDQSSDNTDHYHPDDGPSQGPADKSTSRARMYCDNG